VTTRSTFTLLLLTLAAGCQADLRPDALQERTKPLHEARGRALLAQAAAEQQPEGSKPWKSLPGVEVELTDTYFGFVGWVARAWPENPQDLTFRFVPGQNRAVVSMKDDDGQRIRWGIHEWNAWQQEGSEPFEYTPDDDVIFWLPTIQYFLEAAFRLPEAQIVDDAGPADLHGVKCDRVYLTWVSYEPNDEADQYLAWLSKKDHRLVRLDFTVRDVAGFVVGAAVYSDFKRVGGYLLPHTIHIGSDPPEDDLHVIKIRRWSPNTPLPDADVVLDPSKKPRPKP